MAIVNPNYQHGADKKDAPTFDFEGFFDNVIKKGKVTETIEVTEGLSVELRPLDVQEQLLAELTILANDDDVPSDTINRVRILQILSRSIVAVNGVSISEGDKAAISALYAKLSSLPGVLVDKMFEAYRKLVKKQAELYGEDLVDKIGNF